MKIVVLDGYTENPGDLSWEPLRALGELTVHDRTPFDEDAIVDRIAGAPHVFTNKTPLSRAVLSRCEGLKFVGVLATGYNVVDVDAARELGITVCNIPSYGTSAVAQHTFALLLELTNRVGLHDDAVRTGEWSGQSDFCIAKSPLTELCGKTIGLIGFGRIGQAVARIAVALEMQVMAYDLQMDAQYWNAEIKYAPLDELLRQSDVVSLHCPLTPENGGFMNKAAFDMMKPGAFLVNTARGQLVNERDLADALTSGHLGGAALDVLSQEPIAADNPLLTAPNCILTPHIAWAARESRQRLMDIAVENLRKFIEGAPINVVT